MKILIVDDQEINRECLGDFVDSRGHDVVKASGAMEALDLATGDFDMVITDYQMPAYDGAWLARQLRNRFPDVRILIWTAACVIPDELNDCGANRVLSKTDIDGLDLELRPFNRQET